ncbi:MAG: LPS export ABC transporter periplasmic protein LptC [Limnochordaceae bacterium]|nr:LPS export ABC transporter periplasmic protein LptC [Limnochordaceae bacterium]
MAAVAQRPGEASGQLRQTRPPARAGIRAGEGRPHGRPWAVAVLAALAVGAAGVGIWSGAFHPWKTPPGAERPAGEETAGPAAPPAPGVRSLDIHLVGRHRGERQWQLRAERIELPEPAREVQFRDVKDGVFYREGEALVTFEGDGGRFDEKSGRLVLKGRFRLAYGTDVMESAELTWEPDRELLWTHAPTVIHHGSMTIRSPRMEIDVNTRVIHLSGGVTVDDPGRLRARAERVEYEPGTGAMRFIGPVEVEGDTMADPTEAGGSS